MSRRQRGSILIVVLGILFLIALLATTFATLQTVERRIASNYTEETRAKLIAQSGVDFALDRLAMIVQTGWFRNGKMDTTWVYYGSEMDKSKPPQPSTPLIKAKNPSFAYQAEEPQNPYDANKTPKQVSIEGKQPIGFSGLMEAGRWGRNSELFTLRVLDCQAMINVNDGVKWGSTHSVSKNLKRMLNILGSQPSIGIPDLGDKIIAMRPPNGYRNKFELLKVVDYKTDLFRKFKDFVTVWSWTNEGVCQPVPLDHSPEVLNSYPIEYARPNGPEGKIYRYGHGKNYQGKLIDSMGLVQGMKFYTPGWNDTPSNVPQFAGIWTMDALNPQWIELVDRSPINVNTTSREILVALISDLQGFFLMSRRRPSPRDIFYKWLPHIYTYGPDYPESGGGFYGNREHMEYTANDDFGFLYKTLKYKGPNSSGKTTVQTGPGGEISAEKVADEILACRDRRQSPNIPSVNYATAPFGGPFRSWAQFNEFCDNFVKSGWIQDERNMFWDYKPAVHQTPGWFGGSWWDISGVTVVKSAPQKRWASLAAVDVLKANFNPNVHLNELNPDHNLYLNVDKTDLLCNSIEFCFTPMGFFEIESIGYVLRPKVKSSAGTGIQANDNALNNDNEIVAMKELYTVAKLYDAHYTGNQKQFYQGEFNKRRSNPTTNNNRATESGPEPDNGPQPDECEWDGYVCLPTNLGHFKQPTFQKPKKSLWTCDQTGKYPGCTVAPAGESEYGAQIVSHFQFDHVADYHVLGAQECVPRGQFPNSGESSENYPDKTETVRGPYSPPASKLQQGIADKYRLCRTFRMPPLPTHSETTVTPTPPSGYKYAQSDLRLDGAYVEPHSSFGYNIQSGAANFVKSAQVAMWFKPNFAPECTGRMRTMMSVMDYTKGGDGVGVLNIFYPLPFTCHWMPSYHSYEEPVLPKYGEPTRATSFVYGIGADHNYVAIGGGIGGISPSMNHEWEPPYTNVQEDWNRFYGKSDGKFNYMRSHEWMHLMMQCEAGKGFKGGGTSYPPRIKMWINGRLLPGTDQVLVHVQDGPEDLSLLHGKSIRIGGEYSSGCAFAPRCYFADGTIDEVFIWLSNTVDAVTPGIEATQQIFLYGRYYRVKDSDPMDGRYTSAALPLDLGKRVLPPPNAVSISGAPGGTTETGIAVTMPPAKKKLYAIQWTALADSYGQGNEADGTHRIKPIMYDHFPTYSGMAPAAMSPANQPDKNSYAYETVCDMYVQVGKGNNVKEYGPYRNEVWSPIRDSHQSNGVATVEGVPLQVEEGDEVRFIAKFRVGSSSINTVLLATPVLDDVTLFYVQGATRFYNYIEVNIS